MDFQPEIGICLNGTTDRPAIYRTGKAAALHMLIGLAWRGGLLVPTNEADRIETLGGRFGVESPPGEGTRVWAEVDLDGD